MKSARRQPPNAFQAFQLPPQITCGQGLTLEATDRRFPPGKWALHLAIHNADNNHGTQAAATPSGGHRFDLPPERTAKWRPGPHLACLYGFGPDGARQTFRRNLWVVIAAPDEAPSAEPAAMA